MWDTREEGRSAPPQPGRDGLPAAESGEGNAAGAVEWAKERLGRRAQ